jgi:hypothetical protein
MKVASASALRAEGYRQWQYNWHKTTALRFPAHLPPPAGWPAERQTRFIPDRDLTALLAWLASFRASKPLLLPSSFPEKVIDAAPGGQPVSFSVNGMGCVRLPVVLSCFVGQVPSVTVLSLSLPSATQVKSTILPAQC